MAIIPNLFDSEEKKSSAVIPDLFGDTPKSTVIPGLFEESAAPVTAAPSAKNNLVVPGLFDAAFSPFTEIAKQGLQSGPARSLITGLITNPIESMGHGLQSISRVNQPFRRMVQGTSTPAIPIGEVLGSKLVNAAGTLKEQYPFEPQNIVEEFGQSAATSVPLMGAMIAASAGLSAAGVGAKIGQRIAAGGGALFEGIQNAGETRKRVLQKAATDPNYKPGDEDKAAAQTLVTTVPVSALLNNLTLFGNAAPALKKLGERLLGKAARVGEQFIGESAEEGWQQAMGNIAAKDPWTEGLIKAAVFGGLMGVGAGQLSDIIMKQVDQREGKVAPSGTPPPQTPTEPPSAPVTPPQGFVLDSKPSPLSELSKTEESLKAEQPKPMVFETKDGKRITIEDVKPVTAIQPAVRPVEPEVVQKQQKSLRENVKELVQGYYYNPTAVSAEEAVEYDSKLSSLTKEQKAKLVERMKKSITSEDEYTLSSMGEEDRVQYERQVEDISERIASEIFGVDSKTPATMPQKPPEQSASASKSPVDDNTQISPEDRVKFGLPTLAPTYRGISKTEWESIKNGGKILSRGMSGEESNFSYIAEKKELADQYGDYTIEFKPEARDKMARQGTLGGEIKLQGRNLDINDIARVTDRQGNIIYNSEKSSIDDYGLDDIYGQESDIITTARNMRDRDIEAARDAEESDFVNELNRKVGKIKLDAYYKNLGDLRFVPNEIRPRVFSSTSGVSLDEAAETMGISDTELIKRLTEYKTEKRTTVFKTEDYIDDAKRELEELRANALPEETNKAVKQERVNETPLEKDVRGLVEASDAFDMPMKAGQVYDVDGEKFTVVDVTDDDIKLQDGKGVIYDKATGAVEIVKKFNVPKVPRKLFRGYGRQSKGDAYNGTDVPVGGKARYYAFTKEHAKEFGENVEQKNLDLKNPLIIRSGEEWSELTKAAGWKYVNPYGLQKSDIESATERLKSHVIKKGHDGIIVWWDDSIRGDISEDGGNIKTLRSVFGIPQVIDYTSDKLNTPQAPSEDSLKATIEQAGGKYVGIWKDENGKPNYSMVSFNEPLRGSTLTLPADKVTPENVKAKFDEFAAKVREAEGEKKPIFRAKPEEDEPKFRILGGGSNFYDSFKKGSQYVEVFKNPSESQIPTDGMRVIVMPNGDMLYWDAEHALHQDVIDNLPIPDDAVTVMLYGNGIMNITDTRGRNTKKAAEMINRHKDKIARMIGEYRLSSYNMGAVEQPKFRKRIDPPADETNPVFSMTAKSLVEQRTREGIQRKLQQIFGKYEDLEAMDESEAIPESPMYYISIDHMANLEYAAAERDYDGTEFILKEVRKDILDKKAGIYKNREEREEEEGNRAQEEERKYDERAILHGKDIPAWGEVSKGDVPTQAEDSSLPNKENLKNPEQNELQFRKRQSRFRYYDLPNTPFQPTPTLAEKSSKFRQMLKDEYGINITSQEMEDLYREFYRLTGTYNLRIIKELGTPGGASALGQYYRGVVDIVEGRANKQETLYHESEHYMEDMFLTDKEKQQLFDESERRWKDVLTEEERRNPNKAYSERRAELIIEYAKTRKGLFGRIKAIIDALLERVKLFFGKGSVIRKVHADIMAGKMRVQKPAPRWVQRPAFKAKQPRDITQTEAKYREEPSRERMTFKIRELVKDKNITRPEVEQAIDDIAGKTKFANLTDEQVQKLYDALRVLKPVVVSAQELKSTLEGAQVKKAIFKAAGPRPKEQVQLPEMKALENQIRAEARGARYGAREGKRLGKEEMIKLFKSGEERVAWTVAYIKAKLPPTEQGKYLSAIQQAKNEGKQMSLMLRAMHRAEALEQKELREDIQRLGKPNKMVAAEYTQKIQELTRGVDFTDLTDKKRGDLLSLLAYVKRNQETLRVPEERLQELERLTRKPASQLTTEELREIKEQVELLRERGVLKLALKNRTNEYEYERNRDKLVASTVSLDPKQAKTVERDVQKASALKTYLQILSPYWVARRLDGNKVGEHTRFMTNISRAENDTNFKSHIRRADAIGRIAQVKKNWTEQEQRDMAVLLSYEQGDFEQVNELMTYYNMTKLPEKTQEMGRVMDIMRHELDANWGKIAALYEEQFNEVMGKVENYFPRKYTMKRGEALQSALQDMVERNRYRTAYTKRSFTFKRLPNVKKVPRVDVFAIFDEAIQEQEWYVNMQPILLNAHELFGSEEYQNAAGATGYDYMKSYIDTVARRGWSAHASANPLLKAARINLNNAVLGFRLSSIMAQPFAIFEAVSFVNSQYGPAAAVEVFKEFTKSWIIPGYAKRIIEGSKALKLRMGGELGMEETFRNANSSGPIMGWIKKAGMYPLKWADLKTAAGVQQGIENVLKKHGAKDTREEAEYLMNVVSGSSDITMRPLVLSRGEWARTLLTFQTFALNSYGILTEGIIRDGVVKGDIGKKFRSAVSLGIMFAGAMLLDELRRKMYKLVTDRDIKEKSLLERAVMYIPSQFPVIGDMLEAAVEGRPRGLQVPLTKVFGEGLQGAASVFKGKTPEERAAGALKFGKAAVSLGAGIPGTMQSADLVSRLFNKQKKGSAPGFSKPSFKKPVFKKTSFSKPKFKKPVFH